MADNQAPQTCVLCQTNTKDKSRCVKYNIYSFYKRFNWPIKNLFYLLYSDYLGTGFDNTECEPLLKITNKCELSTTFWEMRTVSELSQPPKQHIVDAVETMVSSSSSCPSIEDANNWICSCDDKSTKICNP